MGRTDGTAQGSFVLGRGEAGALMEIRQLQYFLAVAEQLSFSKAAAILYVTQPLLSQQIADLERQLGAELFVRNRRSVALTPAGMAMYKEASAIFEQMNRAVHAVRNAAGATSLAGQLDIGFEYVFPRLKLTDGIGAFRHENPRTDITISRHSASHLLYMLNKEKLDLAFFTFPFCGFDVNCEFRILEKNWLTIAASKYLLPVPTLENARKVMEEYPIYQLDKDSRGLTNMMQICNALGVAPHFYFSHSFENLLSSVESGMGVAILAKNILESYGSSHLNTVELTDVPHASVCSVAAWNRGNSNPLIPALLEHIGADRKLCEGTCGKHCVLGKK